MMCIVYYKCMKYLYKREIKLKLYEYVVCL